MKPQLNKKRLIEKLLTMVQDRKKPAELLLKQVFSAEELMNLKQQYEFEKETEEWAFSLREHLKDYEKHLKKGDRLYASTKKSVEHQHEVHYERAMECLNEVRASIPEIDRVLLTPGVDGSGDIFGTELVPDNQPRFIYSEAKAASLIKRERVSYLGFLEDCLLKKLSKVS